MEPGSRALLAHLAVGVAPERVIQERAAVCVEDGRRSRSRSAGGADTVAARRFRCGMSTRGLPVGAVREKPSGTRTGPGIPRADETPKDRRPRGFGRATQVRVLGIERRSRTVTGRATSVVRPSAS